MLDIDVTTGGGLETITISSRVGIGYIMYVHKYSGEGSLTKLSAVVPHSNIALGDYYEYKCPMDVRWEGCLYCWICKVYGNGGGCRPSATLTQRTNSFGWKAFHSGFGWGLKSVGGEGI